MTSASTPAVRLVPRGAPLEHEPAREDVVATTPSTTEAAALMLSPARGRLRDALAAHAKAEQELQDLAAGAARLAEIEAAEGVILEKIGALGREEIAAMTAWARSGQGEPPTPDAARRKALAQRLAEIQGKAAAARGAGETLDAVRAGADTNLGAAVRAVDDALVAVALEEVETLAAQFAEAEIALRRQAGKFLTLTLSISPLEDAGNRAKLQRLQVAAEQAAEAAALQFPPKEAFAAADAAMTGFLANLRTDPCAPFTADR